MSDRTTFAQHLGVALIVFTLMVYLLAAYTVLALPHSPENDLLILRSQNHNL